MDRFNARLAGIEQAVAALMLGVIFVAITVGVIARYLVNMPIPWVEEISRFLFIWIGYLAGCQAFAQQRHMVLGVVFERLPASVQRGISIAQAVVLQVLFVWMILPSFRGWDRYVPSNYLRIPEGIVFLIIPLAFLLLSIHNLIILVKQLTAIGAPGATGAKRDSGAAEVKQ